MQRLEEIVRERLLCAFDFDGTLSPIVSLPHEAILPEDIRVRLIELRQYAPVALITGRAVSDIRNRLGFEPDFVVGNHGLEGVPGWEVETARHEELCRKWRQHLDMVLRGSLYAGVELENKRYSLSLHFRHVPDPDGMALRLKTLLESLKPHPRVMSGKYVFNLLAEDACNKGSALAELIAISGAQQAIYVGDDVTDEDVFRLKRSDIMSIRIECAASSEAEFYLPRAAHIVRLLDQLTEGLRTSGGRNWLLDEPIDAGAP